MKPFTLFFLLFCFQSSIAQLPFNQVAPASTHLQEINKEWDAQKLALLDFSTEISFQSDIQRIQFHLFQVVELLQLKNIANLSPSQKEARQKHIDVLQKYAEESNFPINSFHNQRQPYFVDSYGTACAVGHLALMSGAADLVNRIQSADNFEYIAELEKKYPEIELWAFGNGLNMDELALVQPSYSPAPTNWNSMGDGSGIDGIVYDMAQIDGELILVGAFDAVHGTSAKNIVRWNGEEFLNFDVEIEGEIFVAHRTYGAGDNLFIGGDFLLDGVQANIAEYQDGEWTILQNGEMDGAVHTITHVGNNYIVVGGTFKKIDGKEMPYLAAYQDGEWTQTPKSSQSVSSEPGAFSASGPIYDLDFYSDFSGNYLLLSGAFEEIQTNAEISESIDSKNMAFWNIPDSKWESTFDGDYCEIASTGIVDGKIYFGGDVECDDGVNQLANGLYSTMKLSPMGNGQVNDFYSIFGNTFLIGGIKSPEGYIIMNHYSGMYVLEGNLNAALFDSTVHCMNYYMGHYYVAGEYTTINGEEYTNLAYSTLETATFIEEQLSQENLKVFAAEGKIYCETSTLIEKIDLRLYDAGGRIVSNNVFENLIGSSAYVPQTDLQGIYFYELQTEDGWQSGKLFLESGR